MTRVQQLATLFLLLALVGPGHAGESPADSPATNTEEQVAGISTEDEEVIAMLELLEMLELLKNLEVVSAMEDTE